MGVLNVFAKIMEFYIHLDWPLNERCMWNSMAKIYHEIHVGLHSYRQAYVDSKETKCIDMCSLHIEIQLELISRTI